MNAPLERPRDSSFGLGLLLGACVGAGVVLWLAPRGRRAYEHYRQAGVQVGEAVDELMRKGQGIRDEVAEVVAHAAHAVERAATAAKS